MVPSISICIPAYKRIQYLERLLDSITNQTFTDYEVVITDDSPDGSVENLVRNYTGINNIFYHRNKNALGTPENWNEAIRLAKGTWIKIMHDDDWFSRPNSLASFFEATKKNPNQSFFFSAFTNIKEETGAETIVRCSWFDLLALSVSPLHLFRKVYVGNPSCTLIKRDLELLYDKRFKWVVDFEYYIRCLRKTHTYHYIDQPLINIGFNEEQVTQSCFRVPEVEIPESHELLQKLGYQILRNPVVYDYYWRLYRNLGIRKEADVESLYKGNLHPLLKQMLRSQGKFSPAQLKNGFISKLVMFLNFIFSLFKPLSVTNSATEVSS